MSREQNEREAFEEEEDDIDEWEVLKVDDDYEICREYPYQIRRARDGYILRESTNNYGYLMVHLNGHLYLKHRLIAEQFIPNPDNLPQIDHHDHNRLNNHIDNLSWVSHHDNQNNHDRYRDRKIEYVQELPDDVIVVNQYKNYHFEGYYFANDVFYKDVGNGTYRIVPWHRRNRNDEKNLQVTLTDTNTIQRKISRNIFYKVYGLE